MKKKKCNSRIHSDTQPDVFPGAVQQGMVAGTISWFPALKVAILVAVLSGIAGIRWSGRKKG